MKYQLELWYETDSFIEIHKNWQAIDKENPKNRNSSDLRCLKFYSEMILIHYAVS